MTKQISDYTSVTDLRQVIANAKRIGNKETETAAFKRICELEGRCYDDPLIRRFYEMLTAYEELLTQKNGRRTAAVRTRQKIKNKGEVVCLSDWAWGKQPTLGFQTLVENGLADLTAEYIVIEFAHRFPDVVVSSAEQKLLAAGVTPPMRGVE
jgi:hypothetical protein